MSDASPDDSSLPNVSTITRSLRAKDSKHDFLDGLLRSLDTLIFIEIALIYYCDNLTLLLILRAFCQVLYVQYRGPPLPATTQLTPAVLSNLVSIATHILSSRPEASNRLTRGYLHGGLIVDFVGEHGPISRKRLITYDILVTILQLLMLAVGQERHAMTPGTKEESQQPQDLDAEESGRRRSEEDLPTSYGENEEGIEMQSLLPDGAEASHPDRSPPDENDALLVLNLKQNLTTLFRRNSAATAGPTTREERVERLRMLFGRSFRHTQEDIVTRT